MNAQDLKNSILQLAVQGKLVEQRAEEGTARELLEQIKLEKDQLIKDKKIKKSKPLPEITEDEIPFEIPESWEWVRLGELISIESGKGLTSKDMKEGEIPVFGGNGITGYHNEALVNKETVVIGRVGFYCGSVHLTPKEAWVTDNAFITTFPDKSIDTKYLIYILRHMNLGKSHNATAQPVVSGKKIYPLLFPLPPLEEQHRIVAKIEEILPYIDQYDKAYTKLETFNKKFPEDMKKSILQMAMQGKLVEQRPEEGTADELYEQIVAEKAQLIKNGKIKKEKPLPEITEDEIPFEIPSSWKWVRFGELACFFNGDRSKNYPNKNEYVQEGIAWINTGHITQDGYLSDKTMNYITEKKYNSLSGGFIKLGDLVYCLRGATFGKVARVEPFELGAIASSLVIIRLITLQIREYIFNYLKSPLSYMELHKYDNGSAQPNLAAKDVTKYLIPLPPLEEQKRIVAKIEELLPYCDQLIKN